jgi:ribosomal protein L21E
MVSRIGGFRRKTRSKLRKNVREHGKISLTNFFKNYEVGSKVILVGEPAVQKGMFFPRFKGKSGKVVGMMGACYNVEIKDGKKVKTLVVHPVHLREI